MQVLFNLHVVIWIAVIAFVAGAIFGQTLVTKVKSFFNRTPKTSTKPDGEA